MTLLFNHDDSVENMIISGLVDSIGLYVKPTDMQKNLAHRWVKVLGESFYGKRFFDLTSGQQRMVLAVRAIVKNPPLLILDEPTVGLDDYHAQMFIELINSIAHHRNIAIVYVSHRDEQNLKPQKVLQLIKGAEGSVAVCE